MTETRRWRYAFPPMRLTIIGIRGQARRVDNFAVAVVRIEYEVDGVRRVTFTATRGELADWLRPHSLLWSAFLEALGFIAVKVAGVVAQ